jgi:hypothetical protein
LRRLALCAAGASALLFSSTAAWCWETAHGKPDNTSMVDVATAPAQTPRKVDNIGSIAPAAGPVVAPDGTVYVGNEQGKLMSFKPDGTPGWSRTLNSGEAILASPMIGSDGSIYVIGVKTYTDHRVEPAVKRVDSTLHRFTSGGGWASQTPFPEHNNGGGGTTASPNLWRFNGVELIMVTAPYRREVGGGIDIRLLAFTPGGALVADQRATSIVPEITGGFGKPPICAVPVITIFCYLGTDFTSPGGISMPPPPLPGVGLHTNPLGGTPWILVSDHHKDFVGFTFSLADYKFYEVFRVHDENRFMRSAPSFIPDQHSIIGVADTKRDNNGVQTANKEGGVLFSGPNQAKAAPVTGLPAIHASPTRLWDGRTALVGVTGELILLNGRQATARVKLEGGSIVPAAASRTHLFTSTQFAFQTFDPASLTEVARVTWAGGGKSPPVIGPQGHVYAIADQTLFVFGRPITSNANGGSGGDPVVVGGGGVLENTGTPAPQSTSQAQAYKPPLTTNGNRLFACEKLDGDDCGKGDYRSIAKAFCAKNGYAEADDIDVDSKKVKAETLDGQYCTKNKCKVFDEIVCKK